MTQLAVQANNFFPKMIQDFGVIDVYASTHLIDNTISSYRLISSLQIIIDKLLAKAELAMRNNDRALEKVILNTQVLPLLELFLSKNSYRKTTSRLKKNKVLCDKGWIGVFHSQLDNFNSLRHTESLSKKERHCFCWKDK